MANEIKYKVGFDVNHSDLNKLKSSLQQLQKLSISDIMKINDSDRSSAITALNDIKRQATNVQEALKTAFNAKLNTVNIETFNKSLQKSNTSIEQIYSTFSKGGVAGENAFRSLTSQVLTTNVQLKETHSLLDNIATTLSNTVKWNLASSAVNTMSQSIQQAWGYVKNLDTSLNDIRIVTNKSAEQMANFAVQANQAAQTLGRTTTDYTKAALIYAQQGLSDEEIAERTAVTLKTANVTGQSTAEVSEQLTAVWNGYKVSAEQAEVYVDRLAAVAATTASDLQELSTGMSKVASAAAAMGVGEEQLAAQLSTIISVTRQAPESVGTALRTIYARITDIKAGIAEDEVDLGRYSGKMAALGFNVLDATGNLRDMGQVMEEIGYKWQDLTREQQVSLAQTMAGQRQYSNLIALFDNFDKYTEALNTAQNAAGTLNEQQDIYLESTAAHLNQLKTATENLYDSLLNPDSLEPLIDGFADVLSFAAQFVDSLGGGGALLTSLGAIGVSVFSEQIAKGINTTLTNLDIAKENARQFEMTLEQVQTWQGIPGLDQTQRDLLASREQMLSLVNVMSPDQFTAMQATLNDVVEATNKVASLTAQQDILDGMVQAVTKATDKWQGLKDLMMDSAGQEEVIKRLEKQNLEFNSLSQSVEQYANTLKLIQNNSNLSNDEFAGNIRIAKFALEEYQEQLQTLVDEGKLEAHQEQVKRLGQELATLDDKIPAEEAANKLNLIASQIIALTKNAGESGNELAERLKQNFAGAANSLTNLTEQAKKAKKAKEDIFNSQTDNAQRTVYIQGLAKIVGGLSQTGAAINQIQHLGSIFKNSQISDSQKALSLLTNGLPSLIMGIKGVTSAASAMGAALGVASGGITVVFGAVLGLLATGAIALGLYTQAQQQAREETIKTNNAIIEEEKNRQSQIENSQELLIKINDLIQQGELSRSQLRAEIEKLTKEYDVEEDYIQKLIGNYNNLTESIKEARIEREKQRLQSLRTEYASATKTVLPTAADTSEGEQWYGSQYKLSLNSGRLENLTSGDKKLREQLLSAGFSTESNKLINIVDYRIDSIIELYDRLNQYVNEANLSATEKVNSVLYKNIQSWLNSMASTIEEYRTSQKQLFESQLKLDIYNSESSNFGKIDTGEEYLKQRNQLIVQLWKLNGASYEDAVRLVDDYLNESYKKLYNQFNTAVAYIDQLKEKFGSIDNDLQKSLLNLDSDSLAFLQDNFELKSIDSWNELQKIIQYLSSNETLDRLNELTQVITPASAIESAQAIYDLYSSLSNQISSSKKQTISKKEFQKLDPQVQAFFSYMANGQYKMTGDAKEFYETVNNLSLQGFKDNIDSIIQYQNRLKNILSSGNAPNLGRIRGSLESDLESLVPTLNQNSQVFDVLAQNGYNVLPWLLSIQSADIQKRTNALREMLDALDEIGNIDYNQKLIENTKALYENSYAIFSSAESIKDLKILYEDAKIDIQSFGESSEEARIILQAFNAAAIQLNDALDLEGLNTVQLENFTSYLQSIAQSADDLNNQLINNADAAEIVAKSIMKMNDGFEALGKDWDAWVDILQKSTESSEEFEIAMIGAKDAIAQLLDVSKDYVTNDFVKQHLDLITEASNGSADAIDGLKQALTATIVQGIISENGLEGLASEIWSSLADIQAQIPNFEVGMELHDGAFLAKMQNLVNLLQLDADQINALFGSLGFEPTFVTEQMPITQEIPASQDVYREIDRAQFDGVDSANRQFTASFPIVRHFVEDTTETIDGFVDVPALSTNGVTPQIKTITKKATPHFSNYSARNAGGAASPKKQTKTKKSSEPKLDTSTKDTKDYAKDDRDIYHDINIEISQINRELERTQKIQDRLFGKELIANLNKQTDILEKQKVKLREKINLQKLDLAQQKEKLAAMGATFDAEDRISNYFDLLGHQQGIVNGLIDAYNGLVAQYNAITEKTAKDALKDQITEAERQLKKAQDYQKDIETAIKNFDSLRDNMEDLTDEITEISQKQIEINIKRFRMALEIRLDMSEARRDWNQFKREVEQADNVLRDSSTETLIKDVNRSIADYNSYFDVSGSNSIQALTQSLNETMNIIDQIDKMGKDAIYGDDKAQAMQHLKGDLDTLMNSMQSIQGLIQDVDKAILDTVDDVSDLAQKQLEDYDFVNDLYEHDIDLLQLLYGDRQYDAMNAYYGKQQENQLKQIDFLKQYRDLSKQEWDAAVARGESNLAQKWKKEYMQTVQDLNSVITQSVELLQNKYTNAINKIFDTLDKRITGGLGTDYIEMEWELINKNANEYLDEINSAFAIQQLQLKYTNIINDDKSLKNQRALQKVLDEQLKNLRDKDKLTQYDVDRAEKILQIEQARLALEDQKKNKTSLRLRRDSQGNYSYVYAANQEQIANAEEALAKAQNDLYNFDKNAYQKNLDDILSAWRDFQSKYKEIVLDTSLSEEQRVRQLALLRDQYGEYINNKVAENEVIRTNLMESAFIDYAALYDGDYNAYQSMIQSEKEALMGDLVPTWNNGIQEMANTFAGEGGFISACQQGFNDLDAATQEYERELGTLQSVADEDFGQLKDGIDDAAEAFSGLITQNDELISKMQNDMINAIRNLKNELDLLIAKYQAVYDAAKTAVNEANKYIQAQNAIAANEASKDENRFYQPPTVAEQPQSLPAAPTTIPASIPANTSATTSAGTGTASPTTTATNNSEDLWGGFTSTVKGIVGNIYYSGTWWKKLNDGQLKDSIQKIFGNFDTNGNSKDNFKAANDIYNNVWELLNKVKNAPGRKTPPNNMEYYITNYDYYEMMKKYRGGAGTSARLSAHVAAFDTGGYTGIWGTSGRLALLHQKELVLNADDTKNMLDSVAILRGVVDNLGGNISTRLSSLNSSSNNINNNRSTESLDQNVNIQATFPNVNSKREIEEALNDLVNLAAQRAMKRS